MEAQSQPQDLGPCSSSSSTLAAATFGGVRGGEGIGAGVIVGDGTGAGVTAGEAIGSGVIAGAVSCGGAGAAAAAFAPH